MSSCKKGKKQIMFDVQTFYYMNDMYVLQINPLKPSSTHLTDI